MHHPISSLHSIATFSPRLNLNLFINYLSLCYKFKPPNAANQRLVGSTVEVLVEGYSKAAVKAQEAGLSPDDAVMWRRPDQLVGRTRRDEIVVFPGTTAHIGRFAQVRVTAASALTLHGTLVEQAAAARGGGEGP